MAWVSIFGGEGRGGLLRSLGCHACPAGIVGSGFALRHSAPSVFARDAVPVDHGMFPGMFSALAWLVADDPVTRIVWDLKPWAG